MCSSHRQQMMVNLCRAFLCRGTETWLPSMERAPCFGFRDCRVNRSQLDQGHCQGRLVWLRLMFLQLTYGILVWSMPVVNGLTINFALFPSERGFKGLHRQ